MDVNFMRNQRIKKVVCGSYNFTFVYALIYLLLMLVKRVLCSPDWNSGTKKKRIANFHQKRVSFRFWSHKECDQMHIDTKKFLFRVKSRIKDRYMSTVILQNSRYFLFFDGSSRWFIVCTPHASFSRRARKEAGGSLFSIYRGQRYR